MGRKQKAFGKRKHNNFKIAVSKRMLNLKSKNDEQGNDAEESSQELRTYDPKDVPAEGAQISTSGSYECSISENVQPDNSHQLLTNNESIVIEEIYVDDWMSVTSLNIPTDTVIGDCFNNDDFCDDDGIIQRESSVEYDVDCIGGSLHCSEAPLNEIQNISEEDATGSEESTEIPSGRRIVDIFPFFEAIQQLNSHSRTNSCNFSNMRFVKELKQGLNSVFTFVCDVCQYTGNIKSNPHTDLNQQLEVNYASVLGAYAVGIGFYQSQEFLGTLDVPFMAVATFDKRQKRLQSDLQILAQKLEREAMEKEKLMAIERNEVDRNGTPLLAGFVDGSFPKRSYRTHYDSLSGAACIIGLHTKKIIWHGVKNKYCRTCAITKDGEPKEHICNRNYVGPSTGIESQLLLEAFENSEKDFGVRYHKLIADGDSKTYKVIDEAKIYRNPTLKIMKIECILHLYRCAMGLLLKVKNLTSSEAERLLIGIKTAVKHWIGSDENNAVKIENIRKDILNAPHHVFGDHANCNDYFCDKDKHKSDANQIPEMKKSGMYNNIMQALARLLENAKSLLYNLNTNFPEQFNSIIAKHLGGKRVNFCTGLSYAGRVDCAAISFNTGRLVSEVRKYLSGEPALNENSIIYKVESSRLKRRENATKPGYQRKVCLPDKHYGTNTCQRPDLSPEVFEILKNIHLDSLEELQRNRTNIERETKDEANSNYREQIQEDVLTADKIGRICRASTDDHFPMLVENIRYTSETVGNTKEIKHGRIFQNTAIQLLSEILKLDINSCGIFIDQKYGFLGGHPTGLVDDNGIVLIKCPHSTFKMDIHDAIEKRKITFWAISRKRKAGDRSEGRQLVGVNKKHDWFYEVQTLLHVTERKFCIFAVWSGHEENSKAIKYEYLYPDEAVWTGQMETKILAFYYKHLLPEVIDPRKRRGMPIRGVVSKAKSLPENLEIDADADNTDDDDMLIPENQPLGPPKMANKKSTHPKAMRHQNSF